MCKYTIPRGFLSRLQRGTLSASAYGDEEVMMSATGTRFLASLLGLGLAAMVVVGSGCIGHSEDVCKPGDRCVCDGIGSCVRDCDGAGCEFVCDGTGSCELFCPDGDCTAYCEGQGECTLSCPGGGCELFCRGTGSCAIVDCGASCEIHCATVGTCSAE
jgi:hypothetical protein